MGVTRRKCLRMLLRLMKRTYPLITIPRAPTPDSEYDWCKEQRDRNRNRRKAVPLGAVDGVRYKRDKRVRLDPRLSFDGRRRGRRACSGPGCRQWLSRTEPITCCTGHWRVRHRTCPRTSDRPCLHIRWEQGAIQNTNYLAQGDLIG